MTSTPSRARRRRCSNSRYAARCRATAVLPVPGPPCTTSTWSIGARITRSCSAWIVATISRIAPVRSAPISASTGSGMPPATFGRVGVVEVLVEVRRQLALVEHEAPAQVDAERVGAGGAVERRGDRRPPVDDDGVVGVVLDVAPADVPRLAAVRRTCRCARRSRRRPGEWRSSSASSTVTSTYSAVKSSAALCGSTRSSRSIIRSRDAREKASRSRSSASSGKGSTPDTGGGDATRTCRRPDSGF